MKEVRIAELKARLSEYLRMVRRGESVSVLDRDTPIAQLIPAGDRPALHVRTPGADAPPPGRVPIPKRGKLAVDVVQLLLEERQGHR